MEWLNKTLVSMLRSCVDKNQKDWDVLLPKILLGYRSSVQTTTGFSPFSLIYGREALLPIDIVFGGSKERFESKTNLYVNKETIWTGLSRRCVTLQRWNSKDRSIITTGRFILVIRSLNIVLVIG